MNKSNLESAKFAHMFYFKLADTNSELIQEFAELCKKYLSGHQGQIYFSVGLRDFDIQRRVSAKNFEISVNMIFENKVAYERYRRDDRHNEFITQVAGMSTDRIVYDSLILE